MNDKELYHTIYQKRRLEYGQAERDVMISSLQEQIRLLEDALENIVLSHSAHCEHYINVSSHSCELANIAEEALIVLENLRKCAQKV